MTEFVCEKFKEGTKDEFIVFSTHNFENGFAGPGLEYTPSTNNTRMGIMDKNGDFLFELQLTNKEGTKYRIRSADSNGIFYGPVLFVEDNILRFADNWFNFGVHGNVYQLKMGEKLRIQEYEAGFFNGDVCVNEVIADNVSPLLPLYFDFASNVEKSHKCENDVEFDEYVCKSDNESKTTLAAQIDTEGNVNFGMYRNGSFNGVVMRILKGNDLVFIRSYTNGKIDNQNEIIWSKEAGGFVVVTKKPNGRFSRVVYCLRDNVLTLSLGELDSNRKEITPLMHMPTNFKDAQTFSKSKKAKNSDVTIKSEDLLNNLVGLQNVKTQVKRLKAYVHKLKGESTKVNLNMVFTGNPGTGKTETARLIAAILFEEGIIKENKLIEVDRSGLVAEYIGQTEKKVREIIDQAQGGVLFIDEAYALYSSGDDSKDYGRQVIETLMKAMEDERGRFAIIFAGYKEPMQRLVEMNQGFRSRVNRFIDFPDYSLAELNEIAKLMLKNANYKCEKKAFDKISKVIESQMCKENFSNAREVRNILDSLYEIQAVRTYENVEDKTITVSDVDQFIKENKIIIKKSSKIPNIKITKENLDFANTVSVTSEFLQQSTVSISTFKNETPAGEGTGFFITSNGLICTCAHVVKNADKIDISVNFKIKDGEILNKKYDAYIVKKNDLLDIALLQIRNPDVHFVYHSIDDNYPELLTNIVMAGYPFGASRLDNITITEGKIQSINKDKYLKKGEEDLVRFYTDLSGQPGNSGSAVIEKQSGKVIGIFAGCSVNRQGVLINTMNYAIPIKYLFDLLSK